MHTDPEIQPAQPEEPALPDPAPEIPQPDSTPEVPQPAPAPENPQPEPTPEEIPVPAEFPTA